MSPIITGVRFKMFTSNGTFVVPEGVTKIYVTGCGGGGGGNGTTGSGGAGGSSSVGSLISLSGGGGATSGSAGSSGGFGATDGDFLTLPSIGGTNIFSVNNGSVSSGYGRGGNGINHGGGAGACAIKTEVSCISGTQHTVTVGSGGSTGGGSGSEAGSAGFLLIEW